jgi:hypothetical protein
MPERKSIWKIHDKEAETKLPEPRAFSQQEAMYFDIQKKERHER